MDEVGMIIGLLGWRELELASQSGERWYGRKLLNSYNADDLALRADLEWFRQAVWDVRRSMGLDGGELLVRELHIYEELAASAASPDGGVVGALWSFVRPRLKKRRGMVRYGEPSKLYLSREGRHTPRIVYEEVAHSLCRTLPIESSDRRPDDSFMAAYVQSLLRNNPQLKPYGVYWPIACHLDIFRGFLNDSEAYRNSSEEDRLFVRTQVTRLEQVLLCRRLPSRSKTGCPCNS